MINKLCGLDPHPPVSVHPSEVKYNESNLRQICGNKDCDTHELACYKLHYNNFTRNRPSKCLNYHPGVSIISCIFQKQFRDYYILLLYMPFVVIAIKVISSRLFF